MKVCSVETCDNVERARGFCNMHYKRWKTHGDPLVTKKGGRVRGRCSVGGCGRPHSSRGYCWMHYTRWRRHGDPTAVKQRPHGAGTVSRDGYIVVTIVGHPLMRGGGGSIGMHRVVLYEAIGPGSHPCAECGHPVSWEKNLREHGEDALVVDHVDGNRQNNARENLDPVCQPCNTRRRSKVVA